MWFIKNHPTMFVMFLLSKSLISSGILGAVIRRNRKGGMKRGNAQRIRVQNRGN